MATVADPNWNPSRDAFLNSVLEQLLGARREIETFRKRVDSAETERANCCCQRVDLTIGFPDQLGMQPHEWQTDLTIRLQTAETGFSKAREECNNVKESLTAANAEMAFVKKRNQQLEFELFEVRTHLEQGHLPTDLKNNYAAQVFSDNAATLNMDSNITGHWPLDGRSLSEFLATIQAQDAEIKALRETVNKERSVNNQLEQKLAAVVSEMKHTGKTVLETINKITCNGKSKSQSWSGKRSYPSH
ncbi:hypothetical protein EDD18DRAFT_16194 [Armillaria luteobubalina]|uniref:Uncharacterized protein n=1 Tax=Armillaria luteobubalina TaxID=153913 RepID=A0AA39QN86_9AGAR|nr:hypothetical protein EDD18DRAFT_16194 [Armillaria luteobubalina]